MANVAAGISVTRTGASTSIPTLSEVLAYRDAKQKSDADAGGIPDVTVDDGEDENR